MAEGAIQIIYPLHSTGEVYPTEPSWPIPLPETRLPSNEAHQLVYGVITELEGFDIAAFEAHYTDESVVRKSLCQLLGLLSIEDARGHLKDAKQTLRVEEYMQDYEGERKKREQGRPFEAKRVLQGHKADIEFCKYVLAKTLIGDFR